MSGAKGDAERQLAASIIRGLAGGAGTVAQASGDPIVSGVAVGVGGLLGLVAALVETVGHDRAEEILRGLVADPAKPLTDAELVADVERIKREFGL